MYQHIKGNYIENGTEQYAKNKKRLVMLFPILGPQQNQLALVRLGIKHGLMAFCRDMLADGARVICGVGDACLV